MSAESISLRGRAIHRGGWLAISRVICETTAFLSMIVVTRLVTPADVGHAAVAMVVLAVASGLIAGGFGSPIIKERELRDEQVEVAQLLSIGTGLVLMLACAAFGLALR